MIKIDGAKLVAAEKLFRKLPREIKNDLRKYQRKEVGPIWKSEIAKGLDANSMTRRTFKSGNSVQTGSAITLRSGGSSKMLSGGARANDLIPQAEFGSKKQNTFKTYSRQSPNGKRHNVTRRVSRQSPAYRKGGYVVYPAANRSASRITSLSVQTVTRRIYDSLGG